MSDDDDDDDLRAVGEYEGFWSRVACTACGDYGEVEGDVTNGELVTCEGCGRELEVTGR